MRRFLLFAQIVAVAPLAAELGAQATPVTVGVEGKASQSVTAAAAGQFVALAFTASDASGADVFVAVSRDGGATFAAPVRVNATPGDSRAGGEQPARVALITKPRGLPDIAVVWTTKGAAGTRLLTARSTDGGRTFGAPSGIPGGDAAGNRGWESVTVDKTGRLFTMWLDHRETVKAKEQMQTMEGMTHDPTAQAQLSKLYVSALGDDAPRVVTAGVCYCCKTSLVTGGDGALYGVWRHVYAGSQRDIALTVSRDGGRTFAAPVRVSEDHWHFDGCPDNGPALAVDRANHVHVAWPTPPDGKTGTPLALFYATSTDGRTFTPRVRIPTKGPAHHVQMTPMPDGSLLLAWDELTSSGRKVHVARATPGEGGTATFAELPVAEQGSGTYPAVATTANGAVIAWTRTEASGSTIAVQRIER